MKSLFSSAARTALGGAACITLASHATAAHAHLMPAGHGTMNVVGGKAYMVLSIPVSAFSSVDACHDGTLTPRELHANRSALQQQVRSDLALHSQRPAPFEQVLFDLPAGHGHGHDAGSDLVVMVVATVGTAPNGLALESRLWGADGAPIKVRATVMQNGREVRREVARLSPTNAEIRFFAPSGEHHPRARSGHTLGVLSKR
ncbi:MAG: hypothetical protein CL927_10985 [Deltaproteobacteria bacterium]|nr:hypothetical protein [Deltaproteobacteria bacterium]